MPTLHLRVYLRQARCPAAPQDHAWLRGPKLPRGDRSRLLLIGRHHTGVSLTLRPATGLRVVQAGGVAPASAARRRDWRGLHVPKVLVGTAEAHPLRRSCSRGPPRPLAITARTINRATGYGAVAPTQADAALVFGPLVQTTGRGHSVATQARPSAVPGGSATAPARTLRRPGVALPLPGLDGATGTASTVFGPPAGAAVSAVARADLPGDPTSAPPGVGRASTVPVVVVAALRPVRGFPTERGWVVAVRGGRRPAAPAAARGGTAYRVGL